MVYSRIDPSDGRPRYLKRLNNNVILTKDPSGALDDIPDGWQVKEINGRLKVRAIR